MNSMTELGEVAEALRGIQREVQWASAPLWFMAAALVGYLAGQLIAMLRGR